MIRHLLQAARLALLAGVLASSPRVAAQPPETQALAPAIAPAPASPHARGVFFTRTQPIVLTSARITLSSSSDGRGELCTDDKVTLTLTQAQRPVWSWSHTFSSADRQTIACIAPVTLVLPLSAGSYSATIVLEDLYPTTFSSTPYFLHSDAGDPPAGGAVAAAPDSPVPTARPAPSPPISTQPAFTPGLPTTTVVVRETTPADSSSSPTFSWLPAEAVAGAVLLALAAWLLLRRRRSRPTAPAWQGIVDLFDPSTRESRTFPISARNGELAILTQPLRLEAAQRRPERALATLRASQDGPLLLNSGEPVAVEHGQSYVLAGGIQLRYRSLHASRAGRTASRSA